MLSTETFKYSTVQSFSITVQSFSKMITENQNKVLRFLSTGSINENYTRNVAKECNIAVSGSQWILNHLENQGILNHQDIGNIKSYKIDFNDKSKDILILAYSDNLNNKLENRKRELESLKEFSKSAIVFGSYLNKKEPNDIDILFILEKNSDYISFNKKLKEARHIVPIKIHAVLQTKKDLIENIKKKDKIVINALRNGLVLWGNKFIVGVLEDVNTK